MVWTFTLIVHTVGVKVHTVGVKVRTVRVKVHTVAAKVHTIFELLETVLQVVWANKMYFGTLLLSFGDCVRDCLAINAMIITIGRSFGYI